MIGSLQIRCVTRWFAGNTGTQSHRVRYRDQFEGPKREVYLEGNAFFKVTRNPKIALLCGYSKKYSRPRYWHQLFCKNECTHKKC